MRVTLREDERALLEEARTFVERVESSKADLPRDYDERIDALRRWQGELHAAGLVGLSWPREFGGRDAPPMWQILVNSELARSGLPPILGTVGIDVVGPSLIEHGTDVQKHRYLESILSGEELWCQGFSEPEAGSDLASLRTTARVEDDHFVLNGHKVWTSHAQYAQWCAVLTRTDPDVAPHAGISYLLVDMASDGIEVRPLVQVTGDAEFGEVHFDDVRVPREQLLGALNNGWAIAMHTLSHERGWYALNRQIVLRAMFDDLLRDTQRHLDTASETAAMTALVRAFVRVEVLKHHGIRSVGGSTAGDAFATSIDKVLLGEAEQQLGHSSFEVLRSAIGLGGSEDPAREWRNAYFYGRAASVYGGSLQIQNNIIAQRLLNLPRS